MTRISPFLERDHEEQVFVDPSGRRAVAVRRTMRGGALVVAAWLGALILGASGSGPLPVTVTLPARVFAADHRDRHVVRHGVPVARIITPHRDVELPTASDRS